MMKTQAGNGGQGLHDHERNGCQADAVVVMRMLVPKTVDGQHESSQCNDDSAALHECMHQVPAPPNILQEMEMPSAMSLLSMTRF